MKKSIIITILLAFSAEYAAQAQYYVPDSGNEEMLVHVHRPERIRREIVIPMVNGYNVYKVDLHTHTMFSDGQAMPDFRVKEAWCDGLDAIAITDYLGPFCTLMIKQKAGTESVAFEIMNMYCSKKTHPIIEMNIR